MATAVWAPSVHNTQPWWFVADDLGNARLGGIHAATFLFVYVCSLVLAPAFGATAWLTRR